MNRHDTEQLSAYLDGELKASDVAKLEARLKTDLELASVLNDIRAARTLLRKLPSRKSPRNFTLTRKMVGQNPPLPSTYPIFRLATFVATLLFFFSFGINSFGTQMASQIVPFGIGGGGGGGDAESLAAEAPAMEEPAAPAIDDATRIIETQSAKTGEAENGVEVEQVPVQNEAPRFISSAWQGGLAIVALVSFLFMGLMRQVSARRWK